MLTFGMRHVVFLALLAKLLQLKVSHHVNDLYFSTIVKFFCVFAFGGSVGTLKFEIFSPNSDHGAINLPKAIANIFDLVDIGKHLVAGIDILWYHQLACRCSLVRIFDYEPCR